MAFGGLALRFGQTFIYFLALCSSAVVLGIYSFFLASLSHNHETIPSRYKAVEGMSGAAALYAIFAVIFTIFLGGISFFAFIAIILDLLFVGCFIAVAWYTRGGASSCKGFVNTPLGSGIAGQAQVNGHSIRTICRLETAAFAVAIIAALLFLIAAATQILLASHHRKEKKFGPSPANNYTKGSGRTPFWRRGNRKGVHNTRDAEMATAGTAGIGATGTHHGAFRPSHDTGYTGSTVNGTGLHEAKFGEPGYGQALPYAHHNTTTAATNY